MAAASCTDEFIVPADYRTYANLPCPATRSPAIRFTHDANGDAAYSLAMFTSTSALFRSLGSCSNSTTPVSPSPCVAWGACTAPVIECSYPGLGHTTPLGWGDDTWAFFSTFK